MQAQILEVIPTALLLRHPNIPQGVQYPLLQHVNKLNFFSMTCMFLVAFGWNLASNDTVKGTEQRG